MKINIEWSANFAYAIGLLVSDGYVSKDGRHISFVSKDRVQTENFLKALGIDSHIETLRIKSDSRPGDGSVGENITEHYRAQFSDVRFWRYVYGIGIRPAKPKTVSALPVPDEFFFDFFRGVFDGDGSVYSYWDKRWKSSFMFYISIATASTKFANWLKKSLTEVVGTRGHVSSTGGMFQLRYAKAESLKIIEHMYIKPDCICLPRKRLKINEILGTIAPPSPGLEGTRYTRG